MSQRIRVVDDNRDLARHLEVRQLREKSTDVTIGLIVGTPFTFKLPVLVSAQRCFPFSISLLRECCYSLMNL